MGTRANDLASLITTGTQIDSSSIGAGAITNTKYGGALSVDGSGNVGIGTTSPTVELDVVDTMRLSTSTTNYGQLAGLSGALYIGHRNAASDGAIIFGGYGGGSFSEHMRLAPTGNFGIGVNAPATELDVNGTIQDAQGNVRALERNVISSTPHDFQSGSSGKYFPCSVNSLTINIDAADISTGDIFTFWAFPGTGNVTIAWTNMTNGVYIAGDTNNKGTSGSITLAAGGLCTVICDTGDRMVFNGNVS